MSAYLQRLVRPRPAPTVRHPEAARAAGTTGLQEIETFTEAPAPMLAEPREALDLGRPAGLAPSASAPVLAQVLRWVAAAQAPADADRIPVSSPAPLDSLARRDMTNPSLAATIDPASAGTAGAVQAPRESFTRATHDAIGAALVSRADAVTRGTPMGPMNTVSVLSPAQVASRPDASMQEGTAVPPATGATRQPVPGLPVASRTGHALRPAHPSAATHRHAQGDTVSVHVGTLELRVQAPPPTQPHTSPGAALPAARPAPVPPRGPSAEPMRFALGRHHLRWS